MEEPKSSITIKEQGKIADKKSGKTITQDFHYKIYVDSKGEEAAKELKTIKELFNTKVEKKDYPPSTFEAKTL